MRTPFRVLPIVTLALAALFVHADLRGGEKKEQEKKAEDVVVNDQLTNADAKDKRRAQSYCKTYTFKMTKGARYQIDMKSKDFDSYLRLEDPKGNQVAEDDDSGGFPNARIVYQAPDTGDFTIVCTTFTTGATGKYMLTVKQLDK